MTKSRVQELEGYIRGFKIHNQQQQEIQNERWTLDYVLKLKMVYKPDHHEDQDKLEEEQG